MPTLLDSSSLNAGAVPSLLASGAGWQFDKVTLVAGQTLTVQNLVVNTVISVPSSTEAYVVTVAVQPAAAAKVISPSFAILNLKLG